jgi:hypothetical protein
MSYTPEEYEKLKAAYKEALRQRKAILEAAQKAHLRQKAEWHLAQMEAALTALGYSVEPTLPSAEPTSSPSQNETSAPSSSEGAASPSEPKTLF